MTRAERILEARRMIKAGEFDRAVTANEPLDLQCNRLTFECGHWTVWLLGIHDSDTPPTRYKCNSCAAAWVDASDGT